MCLMKCSCERQVHKCAYFLFLFFLPFDSE
ncbi:hypothetical protein ACJIZ3_016368 [Penstemon smallii]|uniref:Uncharacterized protein n=1 Tax=Penstemon smallii TaxID=265156 RepID=A0ABD3RUV1_9LAMI